MSLLPLRHGWVPSGSGLATGSLRQAIHDLRGPLNTLAVLTAVLRSKPAPNDDDTLRNMEVTVRALGAMLERLEAVSETRAPVLEPLGLGAVMREVIEGGGFFPDGSEVEVEAHFDRGLELEVRSCPVRLPAAIAGLLRCCAAALPLGGRLTVGIVGQEGVARLVVGLRGGSVVLPRARMPHKLRENAGDWFALEARVLGLGGQLVVHADDAHPRVVVELPRADVAEVSWC